MFDLPDRSGGIEFNQFFQKITAKIPGKMDYVREESIIIESNCEESNCVK